MKTPPSRPIPSGISVRIEGAKPVFDDTYRRAEPEPGRLVIECRWLDTNELVPATVAFAFLWIVLVLACGFVFGPNSTWFAILGWFLGLAFTAMMSYAMVKTVRNTTTITVDAERIVVRHGPIPLISRRAIGRRELDGLDCKELCGEDDGRPHAFALVARLHSGEELTLVPYQREREACRFAAEEISAYFERTTIR